MTGIASTTLKGDRFQLGTGNRTRAISLEKDLQALDHSIPYCLPYPVALLGR